MAASMADKIQELRQILGPKVDQQLRTGGEAGLDDDTLRRWIVARKGDVKDAAKDLRAHAAWRVAYVPRGRIFEEEVAGELEQKKAFLTGCDKAGRPTCIVVVSRHQMRDAEVSKRYIAYSLDCAALLGSKTPGWDGKMSGIFDLRGLKASNCDFATLRNVFDLLQNHYPERLHKLWLFCAPMIFYGLWKLVYPFIDPVTREKVQFVHEKDAMADFATAFDPAVLPPEIQPGGTGRWITVDEQYGRLLREQGEGQGEGAAATAAAAAAATVQKEELQQQAASEVPPAVRQVEVAA